MQAYVPFHNDCWRTGNFAMVTDQHDNMKGRSLHWDTLRTAFEMFLMDSPDLATERPPEPFSRHVVHNYRLLKEMQARSHGEAEGRVLHVQLLESDVEALWALVLATVHVLLDGQSGREPPWVPQPCFFAQSPLIHTRLRFLEHVFDVHNKCVEMTNFVQLLQLSEWLHGMIVELPVHRPRSRGRGGGGEEGGDDDDFPWGQGRSMTSTHSSETLSDGQPTPPASPSTQQNAPGFGDVKRSPPPSLPEPKRPRTDGNQDTRLKDIMDAVASKLKQGEVLPAYVSSVLAKYTHLISGNDPQKAVFDIAVNVQEAKDVCELLFIVASVLPSSVSAPAMNVLRGKYNGFVFSRSTVYSVKVAENNETLELTENRSIAQLYNYVKMEINRFVSDNATIETLKALKRALVLWRFHLFAWATLGEKLPDVRIDALNNLLKGAEIPATGWIQPDSEDAFDALHIVYFLGTPEGIKIPNNVKNAALAQWTRNAGYFGLLFIPSNTLKDALYAVLDASTMLKVRCGLPELDGMVRACTGLLHVAGANGQRENVMKILRTCQNSPVLDRYGAIQKFTLGIAEWTLAEKKRELAIRLLTPAFLVDEKEREKTFRNYLEEFNVNNTDNITPEEVYRYLNEGAGILGYGAYRPGE